MNQDKTKVIAKWTNERDRAAWRAWAEGQHRRHIGETSEYLAALSDDRLMTQLAKCTDEGWEQTRPNIGSEMRRCLGDLLSACIKAGHGLLSWQSVAQSSGATQAEVLDIIRDIMRVPGLTAAETMTLATMRDECVKENAARLKSFE